MTSVAVFCPRQKSLVIFASKSRMEFSNTDAQSISVWLLDPSSRLYTIMLFLHLSQSAISSTACKVAEEGPDNAEDWFAVHLMVDMVVSSLVWS